MLAPLLAALGAFVFGWFCVRLSGVYLAMLTLAFAQIVWSVAYQWDAFTGGSNGLIGVWPAAWLAPKPAYYWLTLACAVAGCGLLVRVLLAPFGYALRAGRDSPLRADAIGIDVKRLQWAAFVIAGTVAGLAGALYAFSKGRISPETLGVGKSVDGLVMVLLGGIQTRRRPVGRRRHSSPGCRTRSRATPTTGARCSAGHPGAGAGVPARHRRRAEARLHPRARGGGDEHAPLLTVRGLAKSFGGVHAVDGVELRPRRRRAAGADRPERRRQDDLLQHGQRPARARRAARSCSTATSWSA